MRKKSRSLRSGYTASMLQGGKPLSWRGRKSQFQWIQAKFKLNHSKSDVSSAAIHLTCVMLFFCESVVKPRVRGKCALWTMRQGKPIWTKWSRPADWLLSFLGGQEEQPWYWKPEWATHQMTGWLNDSMAGWRHKHRQVDGRINQWLDNATTKILHHYMLRTVAARPIKDSLEQNNLQCWKNNAEKYLVIVLGPEWERVRLNVRFLNGAILFPKLIKS